jgi:xylulokinase
VSGSQKTPTGPVTAGIDIGTTSVKALAVAGDGTVVARARVPHKVIVEGPDKLEHDARRAWRSGPVKAFRQVSGAARELGFEVAGVCVSSMVPSLAAVDRRGVPSTPGLLYGDVRGRLGATIEEPSVAMHDAEGFLNWAVAKAPDAFGYWPAQAVATNAIGGVPAIDTAMTASLGVLHSWGKWNEEHLSAVGVDVSRMPEVVPMGESAGTIPGTETHIAGGTVDALCDQLVAGASEVGDVLAIIGATLVVWIVTDEWLEVPGLWTVPHTVPDRVLVGGPSNAGALFVDWARRIVGGLRPHGSIEQPSRRGDPYKAPVWLPYLRGERVPFHDPDLRSSLHGLDITSLPADLERAAYEGSGFVIQRMLDISGITPRRVVASGGGSRVPGWTAAIADATGVPVESVFVPEGAALGASYLARMAAGLETQIEGADRWARTGRRTDPDAEWAKATRERYRRFLEHSPFVAPEERVKRD